MSLEWYLIDNPVYTEGTEKSDFEFYSDKGFNDYLADTPLVAKNTYLCSSDLSSEQKLLSIIQNNVKDSVSQDKIRQALVKIGTITTEAYIKTAGHYWLIQGIPSNNGVYEKAILQLCNYKLRFQNAKGEIIERWIVSQDASSYSTGVEEQKVFTLGSDQLLILVPADKETIAIERDKRFLIDLNHDKPTCYKLTRVDTTTYTVDGIGYCAWIVSEDQFNKLTDNKELMLCDYIDSVTLSVSNFKINYTGKLQIRVGGSPKTFTAETSDIVSWSVKGNSNAVVINDIGNNQCQIKCNYNEDVIGNTFDLIAKAGVVSQALTIQLIGGI